MFLHLSFGQFKGKQNAAADFESVLDGLEAGRERFPIVMPEVGVGGSCGEDEVVAGEPGSGGEAYLACGRVDRGDLVHENFNVGLVEKDGADGLGNVCRRKHGQRDLIEQRLEGVVIAAVDEGDIDGQMGQGFGGMKAGKAAAYDDDARAAGLRWGL
jgi:hypothetical protein